MVRKVAGGQLANAIQAILRMMTEIEEVCIYLFIYLFIFQNLVCCHLTRFFSFFNFVGG